jgi:hypothetical protein
VALEAGYQTVINISDGFEGDLDAGPFKWLAQCWPCLAAKLNPPQNTPPNHQSVNKNQQILKCYFLDFLSIKICCKIMSRLGGPEMSLLGKRMMTL